MLQFLPSQRHSRCQIAKAPVWAAPIPFAYQSGHLGPFGALYVTQADPDCRFLCGGTHAPAVGVGSGVLKPVTAAVVPFGRAINPAAVDIRGQDLDSTPPRLLNQGVRGVEAHRLLVQ
jgi:hypothetical protein